MRKTIIHRVEHTTHGDNMVQTTIASEEYPRVCEHDNITQTSEHHCRCDDCYEIIDIEWARHRAGMTT